MMDVLNGNTADEVDELRDALDHIQRVARNSRMQTARIRWIEARARCALTGDEPPLLEDIPPGVDQQFKENKQMRKENKQMQARLKRISDALQQFRQAAAVLAMEPAFDEAQASALFANLLESIHRETEEWSK